MNKLDRPRMNLLIVDDHKVVQNGVRFVLSGQTALKFRIHEASNLKEALYFGSKFKYDIILMDINLKHESGIDATREILKINPEQKILAFTVREDRWTVQSMLKAGAQGFLLKDSGAEELIKAIETVSGGSQYFSNRVALGLLNDKQEERKLDGPPISVSVNEKERNIIKLIAEQKTNAEIGAALGLQKSSIDTYRKKILSKFNLKNSAGLIHFAMKHHIID